jgi:GTP-binding protein LepA
MPQDYVGAVMTFGEPKARRANEYGYHGRQVMLTYEIPLAEIVLDFFDRRA